MTDSGYGRWIGAKHLPEVDRPLMVRKTWLLYLWPGLLPLTVRPTWTAFLGGSGLAVAFHLALLATILWPEWLSQTHRTLLWSAVGCCWLAGIAWSYRFVQREKTNRSRRAADDPYPTALQAYLRGNLSWAESLVRQTLHDNPRDVESALLLAAIWRRRQQWDAAEKLLRNLARLETAAPWLWEIEREIRLVGEHRAKHEQHEQKNNEQKDDEQENNDQTTNQQENQSKGEVAGKTMPDWPAKAA